MSSELLPRQTPTLDDTLGAVFLGVIFSCILFGISTLQVYLYYHFYPSDSRLHKFSVAILWILDVLHVALTVSASYRYGVRGFGDLLGLGEVLWEVKLLVAVNVLIILLVQSLYAYRVWVLGGYHHGVLGYLVCGVVLGGFAVGIVLSYATYTVDHFVEIESISWAIYVSFTASTAIDIILSGAMCFYLLKSQGAGRVLNSRIAVLMQYTLSCGVFTSLCSVACLLSFVVAPDTLTFLAMSFILTRLYTNSFMAMLNARPRQRSPDSSGAVVSFTTPSHGQLTSSSVARSASLGRAHGQRSLSVNVHRDVQQLQSASDKYDLEMGSTSPQSSTQVHAYARGW
ncbi:hypothetical protein MKEN_00203900 [Mycena kentingensis (nom. inval.)]|nr:hypothetical protein MKEN_00203900 [Mycena kentingensis (nom. inval.)]